MNTTVTEKDYPIKTIWLLKQAISMLAYPSIFLVPFTLIFAGIHLMNISSDNGKPITSDDMPPEFFAIFLLFILIAFILFLIQALQWKNFRYALEDKFIVLHQGVITKQNRHIPYGRVQGIFINQGIFERIFGLAALTFEDFSQGGRSNVDARGRTQNSKISYEIVGFAGNKIHIPGLKKEDAEALKTIMLQRIKANPIEDSQSGL